MALEDTDTSTHGLFPTYCLVSSGLVASLLHAYWTAVPLLHRLWYIKWFQKSVLLVLTPTIIILQRHMTKTMNKQQH